MASLAKLLGQVQNEILAMAKGASGPADYKLVDRIINDVIGLPNLCSKIMASDHRLAVVTKAVCGPKGELLLKFIDSSLHDTRISMVEVLNEASLLLERRDKESNEGYEYLRELYKKAVARYREVIGGKGKNPYEGRYRVLRNFANIYDDYDGFFDDDEDSLFGDSDYVDSAIDSLHNGTFDMLESRPLVAAPIASRKPVINDVKNGSLIKTINEIEEQLGRKPSDEELLRILSTYDETNSEMNEDLQDDLDKEYLKESERQEIVNQTVDAVLETLKKAGIQIPDNIFGETEEENPNAPKTVEEFLEEVEKNHNTAATHPVDRPAKADDVLYIRPASTDDEPEDVEEEEPEEPETVTVPDNSTESLIKAHNAYGGEHPVIIDSENSWRQDPEKVAKQVLNEMAASAAAEEALTHIRENPPENPGYLTVDSLAAPTDDEEEDPEDEDDDDEEDEEEDEDPVEETLPDSSESKLVKVIPVKDRCEDIKDVCMSLENLVNQSIINANNGSDIFECYRYLGTKVIPRISTNSQELAWLDVQVLIAPAVINAAPECGPTEYENGFMEKLEKARMDLHEMVSNHVDEWYNRPNCTWDEGFDISVEYVGSWNEEEKDFDASKINIKNWADFNCINTTSVAVAIAEFFSESYDSLNDDVRNSLIPATNIGIGFLPDTTESSKNPIKGVYLYPKDATVNTADDIVNAVHVLEESEAFEEIDIDDINTDSSIIAVIPILGFNIVNSVTVLMNDASFDSIKQSTAKEYGEDAANHLDDEVMEILSSVRNVGKFEYSNNSPASYITRTMVSELVRGTLFSIYGPDDISIKMAIKPQPDKGILGCCTDVTMPDRNAWYVTNYNAVSKLLSHSYALNHCLLNGAVISETPVNTVYAPALSIKPVAEMTPEDVQKASEEAAKETE